jgi:hypothetical protein
MALQKSLFARYLIEIFAREKIGSENEEIVP